MKIFIIAIPLLVVGGLLAYALQGAHFAILDPKGIIADKERGLLIFTTLLSLVVVVPVFVMLFVIVWRYRATNTKAIYSPEWDGSRFFETLWWGIPCLIILVLAIVTWTSSHQLDPTRSLTSTHPPLKIQVVALQWKWLFLYPDQQVASVNTVEFPINTPIEFDITADAPMNSFWIPSLGGQIYAMPGMTTKLHLMADTSGTYAGSSANLSGTGFSGMRFSAIATSASDYANWLIRAHSSSQVLTSSSYTALAVPSADVAVRLYRLGEPTLYDTIVMKYMMPSTATSSTDTKAVNSDMDMDTNMNMNMPGM